MIKKISVIIITIIMLASIASAYSVPPELRTGTQMSEYEVIKVALTAYDAGSRDRWVLDTLRTATYQHTTNRRVVNDYQKLRGWMHKIENQIAGIKTIPFIEYGYSNPYNGDGEGWCTGYDERCRNKVN